MESRWELLMQRIDDYTGLSPTALFTILALMFGVYHVVCQLFFVDPKEEEENEDSLLLNKFSSTPAPPVSDQQRKLVSAAPDQEGCEHYLGQVSEEELRAYDGSDPNKPLLMAIKAQIYDVSPSRMFYGPGGPYALFAGKDASRALALMSFDPKDLTGNIEGLGPSELEILQDWEYKFQEKYAKVGQLVTGSTSGNTESIERTD